MFIVRWLLGNPIITTWIALASSVIATLLFFGVGSGSKEDTPRLDTSVSSSVEKISNIKKGGAKGEQNDKEMPLINGANKKVENKNENADKPSSNDKKKIATTTPSIKEPIKSELKEATKPTAKVSLNENNATTDLSQVTNEEMLQMAREAYWNNGLDEAAQIYNKLIENEPKVLEYKGELGNVYWRQGFPEKAAELYSEIAIPMIEKGRADKVANMIGFIGLFYPERAAEIHRRMLLTK